MNYYDEDECNAYVGTDSTIFPAFMSIDEGLITEKKIKKTLQV